MYNYVNVNFENFCSLDSIFMSATTHFNFLFYYNNAFEIKEDKIRGTLLLF